MPDPKNVVVIGGGISGLVCAYRLKQLGVPVILLETAESVGGAVGTVRKTAFSSSVAPRVFRAPRRCSR